MRISNQMMATNVQAYLSNHTESLLKIQERIATGKRINRPSDDPIGMGQMLNYRQSIASLKQYGENITDAKLHIDTVESILDAVTDLLSEAKTIAGDLHPDMREMLAEEVGILRDQMLQLANSKNKGSYIFGGDITNAPPFNSTTGEYTGDSGSKDYLIGDSMQLSINADGGQIFQGAQDVFAVLQDLQTALAGDDAQGISDQLIPLTEAINNLNTVRAVNGGQNKRLEATQSHYAQFQLNMEELLSSIEDADMAEAIIDLQIQQVAYESTLNTAAQIIRPSLIDFMK